MLLTNRTSSGIADLVANRETGLIIGRAKEEFVLLVNSVIYLHVFSTCSSSFSQYLLYQQEASWWHEEDGAPRRLIF